MKQTWKIDSNLKLFFLFLTKKVRYNVSHEVCENSHRYSVEGRRISRRQPWTSVSSSAGDIRESLFWISSGIGIN